MFRTPLFLTLGVCLTALGSALKAAEKPNVVIILVDDLGIRDLGVEGSTFYETPQIDALANGSFRFTNAYSSSRVCSPTRASLQLGQSPIRHGITQYIGGRSGMNFNRGERLFSAEYVRQLPSEPTTLAEAMNEGGYRTFFAGKWHLGGEGSLPTDHGFDLNVGGYSPGTPPGGFFSPYRNQKLTDGPQGESLTLRLADETCGFIESVDDQEPFFAMLSFYAVHAPVQTRKDLWEKYRIKAQQLDTPENRFKIDRTLPVRQVQDHPVYAGMMETLDDAVGKVLNCLDQQGIAENTIVIFTGDNGGVSSGDAYSTSALPLRGGKGRQWEGGIRAPLYIRFPKKFSEPALVDQAAITADLFPTLLDLCGLPARQDDHLDGVSLVPALSGSNLEDRDLFWHYPHYDNQGGQPSAIIRRGDWKLIHYFEDEHCELYHLPTDIGELSDLSSAYPVRREKMQKDLLAHLSSLNANIPEPDPRYSDVDRQNRAEKVFSQRWSSLEKNHAAMHRDDWRPNKTWWDSMVTKD
ncbi:MAG: sulfatase [Planctomycetota bacterium]